MVEHVPACSITRQAKSAEGNGRSAPENPAHYADESTCEEAKNRAHSVDENSDPRRGEEPVQPPPPPDPVPPPEPYKKLRKIKEGDF